MFNEMPKKRMVSVFSEDDKEIVILGLNYEHTCFRKPISDRWIQHRKDGKLIALQLKERM